MLPNNKGDKSNCQQNEEGNIQEACWSLGEEFLSVFKENTLKLSFISPETKHSYQDNGNKEAENCKEDLKTQITRPESMIVYCFTYPIKLEPRHPKLSGSKHREHEQEWEQI